MATSNSLSQLGLVVILPTSLLVVSAGLVAYQYGALKTHHLRRAAEVVASASLSSILSFAIGSVLGYYFGKKT